jgi:hypothetical protein
MGLRDKLLIIQSELKAPKGQVNNYGGYKYRSCEDILEAVKPLLKANGCILTITDSVEQVGERYYIKAEATLSDTKTEASLTNVAYAREEEVKKGMDASQITGTASSYARKYALNGLFLIDDTKDADTDEHAKQTGAEKKEKTAAKKATPKQIELVKSLVKDIDGMLKYYKVEKIEDLTMEQASETITKLKGVK